MTFEERAKLHEYFRHLFGKKIDERIRNNAVCRNIYDTLFNFMQEHCLDKGRVENIILPFISRVDKQIIKYPNMPVCIYCGTYFNKKRNSNNVAQKFILNELIKELKLNAKR